MNAREWLARGSPRPQVALLGAPVGRASLSPSRAWTTPPALREALARFPTWEAERRVDLARLAILDLGDVEGDERDADARAVHARVEAAVGAARRRAPVLAVVGGDNSVTLPIMRAMSGGALGEGWGLLTVDAHHDVRPRAEDGLPRNGTPVRDLIEDGLPGARVVQVGIGVMANAREHADWAASRGIRWVQVGELRRRGVAVVVTEAVQSLAASGATRLHVDLDLDVLDRAFAPACPASMPGGLAPADLLEAAFVCGRHPAVASVDFTEVDARADVAGITVRTLAAALLSFCAGVALREGGGGVGDAAADRGGDVGRGGRAGRSVRAERAAPSP